ncbi:pre-mRNA-splicing ATP-dependent RNA helicase PRP28 [Microthyrium microscopicum]|uniref:RNA helicase n=1 Tax=Microthyrium microscopicum TaxID=703497 RepID=A0A6A6UE46_9PEZI|nr:pre-mRNA-splicing ATP-dependent RNA helicase PRP28 [Microthyrium microscopicum]
MSAIPPPPPDVPPPPPSDAIPPPPSSTDIPPPPPPLDDSGPVLKKKVVGTKKKDPPKVEELLKKKFEADAAKAKVRFIPKAERERLAKEAKIKEEQDAKKRQEAAAKAPTNGASKPQAKPSNVPKEPASMRPREGKGRSNGKQQAAPKNTKDTKRTWEDLQEDMIKERYLGPDLSHSAFSANKKRKRTRDKFNFDWDANEDTTITNDPIYQNRTPSAIEIKRKEKADLSTQKFGKHWSAKRLEDMKERDWRIFKEDFDIQTKGGSIPDPMRNWQESTLPKQLMDVIDQVGYTDPTPIQRAAIPIALKSRDLIGVAVTGSGKTAAFLLPLLVYISNLPRLDSPEGDKEAGPYAIILAPTRELAQQIELEAKKFATPLKFTCVSIVGGHSIEEQAYRLRDGAEIVIATPGRLVDCIERRLLVLAQCCYIIMDEADRMIDLGFEDPVNRILDALPVQNEKPDTDDAESAAAMSSYLGGQHRYRQTMMYTATMPSAVERIARKYLRRPAIVTIGNVGEAVETVEQRVEFVSGEDRRKKRLNEILASRQYAPPIIVFVNIKRNCDAVARDVRHMGFSAVTLHGSKTQDQREAALASLRAGNTDVLVATDLAGRGIDVPNVSLVVNFNMAHNIESYTHRIGRTGRAGKSGIAITFLGPEDNEVMYDLKQMMMKSNISNVPEELRKHEASQQKPKGRQPNQKKDDGNGFLSGNKKW